MSTHAEHHPNDPRSNPASGPDWTGITGFLAMILRAVESVDWFGKPGYFVCGGGYHRQEFMMRLLTYHAVIGAQTVDEIAAKLAEDRCAQLLAPGELPDASTLLRFAEAQAEALRRCVAEFWKLSSMLHFGQRPTPPATADDCVAVCLDRWLEAVHAPPVEPQDLPERLLAGFSIKMP